MLESQTSAPADEPVTRDEAKTWLKVTHGEEDDLIDGLITSARQLFETETGRQVISADWLIYLEHFPRWPHQTIRVPRPPLTAVSSLKYRDPGGTLRTLAEDRYNVIAPVGPDAEPGRIDPAPSTFWPDTAHGVTDAVQIAITAGAADAPSVPEDVKRVIRQILGLLYDYRGPDANAIALENATLKRALGYFRAWP